MPSNTDGQADRAANPADALHGLPDGVQSALRTLATYHDQLRLLQLSSSIGRLGAHVATNPTAS